MNKNHQAFNLSEAQIYRLSRAKTEHLVPIASSVPGYIYDRENKTVALIDKRPGTLTLSDLSGGGFGFGKALIKPNKEKLIWQKATHSDILKLIDKNPNQLVFMIRADQILSLEGRKDIVRSHPILRYKNIKFTDVYFSFCPKGVKENTTVEQYEKSI